MVEIQSKEAIDKISEELKVQPALAIGRKLNDNIQPVFEIGNNNIVNVVESRAGTGTILTTPSDRDFYLTYANMACGDKDQNAVEENAIKIDMANGAEKVLLTMFLSTQAATSDSGSVAVNFNPPIKLLRGSTVTSVGNSASTNFTVGGYTTDPL